MTFQMRIGNEMKNWHRNLVALVIGIGILLLVDWLLRYFLSSESFRVDGL